MSHPVSDPAADPDRDLCAGRPGPANAPLSRGPAAPGAALLAYRVLTALAAPAAPLLLAVRERRGKEEPGRRGERLGMPGRPRPHGPLLWCHAASVGETNAVVPLLTAIRARRPDLNILLTTGTTTSAQLVAERLAGEAIHQYLPLDVPAFANRFLDHWRPDLAVFVESEVWPNLVLALARRAVPLALVNGRLSERSFQRWRARPGLSRPLFGRFRLILAQNELMARQFAQLGAADVRAVGNLKMDAPAPPVDQDELHRLRALIGPRPVLLAASTHGGEEEILIEVHRAVRTRHPRLLTIIAPRHPARGPEIVERLRAQRIAVAQRSAGGLPDEDCGIYVADTIGELGLFFTLAPVAYIGGSLVGRGGQNPVEAVRLGAAVLSGPHYDNFVDAYGALVDNGGCRIVRSGTDLTEAACALLGDEPARRTMLRAAEASMEGMRGALDHTLAALQDLLPTPPLADGPAPTAAEDGRAP